MMTDCESFEIKILVDAIRLKYGYDFSRYAPASLTRRIRGCLADTGLTHISELVPRILHDEAFFLYFLQKLSVNVTEMFRDPLFFLSLRQQIIPRLRKLPFVRIWTVGTSTGEEAYSLAIVLKEEGLYDAALIYATDFNDTVLAAARKGIYSMETIRTSTRNYQQAGGRDSFGTYYHADDNSAILDSSLRTNMVFAHHNLATDSAFGEMDLILCRNVLIYFNRELQDRALELFNESLSPRGFLCLGSRETLDVSAVIQTFAAVDKKHRIFQK